MNSFTGLKSKKLKNSLLSKAGSPATVYDVCISPEFFTKINKIHRFMGFFMSVVFEGLESKYSIKIDRSKRFNILK